MTNKIRCTFPKKDVSKEDYHPGLPKCDCDKFTVWYDQNNGMVTIRCSRNLKHILTSYQLEMMEVKNGELKPIGNSPNNGDSDANNSGNNAVECSQETDKTNAGNNRTD